MYPNHLPLVLGATVAVTSSLLFHEMTAAEIESNPAPYPVFGNIERLDPAFDDLVDPNEHMEALAVGFDWSEGPVWMDAEQQLIFSDVPRNTAYRWRDRHGIDVFLKPSGFTGNEYDGREPGSNGLNTDLDGRLLLCQHGDRRIARLNPDGRTFATIADRWDGRRFNSPNDQVMARDGRIFFTDPPYGMGPGTERDIEWHGVYRIDGDGSVSLVTKELERPNGLGLSPDERTLYVTNSHVPRPVILAFDLDEKGNAGRGRVFFDTTHLRTTERPGGLDGMAVDEHGNIWTTAPGGVIVLTPDGKHLGSLLTGRPTGNCTFGGSDGSHLFITADDTLVRIKTKTKGFNFGN